MLSKDFKNFFMPKYLKKNTAVGFILLCSIFFFAPFSHTEEAASSNKGNSMDVDELNNSLIFSENEAVKGLTPLQIVETKIKDLGYTLNSFMPQITESSARVDTIMETVIRQNVENLIMNHGIIEAYKQNKNLSEAEKKEGIQRYETFNKALNKGLSEIKAQYSDKFKATIEDKVTYMTNIECEASSGSSVGCGLSIPKTFSEIKETGLNKNSALAKVFSQGVLKGFVDPKLFISEEEHNEQNSSVEQSDELKPLPSKSEPPKNEKECAAKSLDMYREKIEKISKGNYVAFVSQGAASPCRLLRLAYTIDQSPFKRVLKEGTFFNWNGKTTTLDQKAFDGILQSWGVLNGTKSSKPSNSKNLNTNKDRRFKHSSGKR